MLYLSFLNLRFMLLEIMIFLNFEVLIDKIFFWTIISDSILFEECFMISQIWLFWHQLNTKVIFKSFSFSMFSTISKVYFGNSSSYYTSNINCILSTFEKLTIIFMNISIHSVFKSEHDSSWFIAHWFKHSLDSCRDNYTFFKGSWSFIN